MFVSNQGDVYPAGFLPLASGNVRIDNLVNIYRDSPLFTALHTPSMFKGKCGECEFRSLCGGSRARAFAYTGDPLASDPFCPYEPRTGARRSQRAGDRAGYPFRHLLTAVSAGVGLQKMVRTALFVKGTDLSVP